MNRAETRLLWAGAASLGLFVVGVAALLAVAVAVALFWPFEPFGVNDHDLIPTTACPGEPIEVRIDYAIRPGYDVRSIKIESIWHPVAKLGTYGGTENGGTGTIYGPKLLSPGRHTIYSPIIRTAPANPGVYWLQNVADVAATREPLDLPNFQRYEYRSGDLLTVLPENHSRCSGEVLLRPSSGAEKRS